MDTSLQNVIRSRRTIKPDKFNGQVIPDEVIMQLIAGADWAPTHGRTEPWRFILFAGDRVKQFTERHAELYKLHTDPALFVEAKQNKLRSLSENVSHIIIAWMKRSPAKKVPEIEEIAAASAAIQNLLLTATAKGIAAFWSTSGLTHDPVLKAEFNMGTDDVILGIIYLGYSDEPLKEGYRMIPLSEKIEWVR